MEEKLFKASKIKSKEEFEEAFLELKKYFILNEVSEKPLGMSSKLIDDVWHQFILFTKEYHSFCHRFFGGYIHHVPNTSFTPINDENGTEYFVDSYINTFGTLPEIWGIKLNYADADCNGCNTCSQGERTKTYTVVSLAGCSECNGCGTGTFSCEPSK